MMTRILLTYGVMLAGLAACGDAEDRQPTAEEVKRYTQQIERAEAEATEKAVRESRAKEQVRDEEHQERVPSQN